MARVSGENTPDSVWRIKKFYFLMCDLFIITCLVLLNILHGEVLSNSALVAPAIVVKFGLIWSHPTIF